MVAITEVMDLDEEIYQRGEVESSDVWRSMDSVQSSIHAGAKEQVERASEAETIEGLANHIGNLIEDDPELMVIWGSGGTLKDG